MIVDSKFAFDVLAHILRTYSLKETELNMVMSLITWHGTLKADEAKSELEHSNTKLNPSTNKERLTHG